MQATARTLEYRFGLDAALAAVSSASVGTKLGIGEAAAEIGVHIPLEATPPLPAPPTDTQTSLELPWRLQISPDGNGAFAQSPVAVEHNGRFELWHTRLGVRAHDKDGNPTVDELSADQRTVRAIWARDFDVLAGFGFTSPPASNNFPEADGSEDQPKNPPIRLALNSRDRMMLVHDVQLPPRTHGEQPGERGFPKRCRRTGSCSPLGGWLTPCRVRGLPDGGLTIEEWKHRALLGRTTRSRSSTPGSSCRSATAHHW
jgi:hypothetical protein